MAQSITNPAAMTDDSWLDKPATEEDVATISDPGFMDYVKDIMPSFASGMEKNISSYPGAPGDIYELARAGDVVSEKYLGDNDPARIKAIRDRENPMPTTEQVHDALTSRPYTPKTWLGRGIEEVTSLLGPRGIVRGVEHLGRDVVAPYLLGKAGETGGALLGPEESQLLSATGGLASRPLGEGIKRVATRAVRGPLNPEAATTMRTLHGQDAQLTPEAPNARAERMRYLQSQGVEVSGGQALGSEMVKRIESGPSNKGGAFNEQQNQQLTRAALRAAGINADSASPEVLHAAQEQFGRDYEALIRRGGGVTMDPTLETRLLDIGSQFEDLKGTAEGSAMSRYFNRIVDAAHQHGGVIPPEVFQQINSEMSATMQAAASAPELAVLRNGLRDMRDAMYESVARNGQPELADMSRDLNNRYRNFKIVEDSVGGAGEGVSFGQVSAGKLRAAVEKRDPSGYRQGQGDLAPLARAAQSITPLPTTGTGSQNITSSLIGLGHAGMVAPFSALIRSRPVRTSIVNRATGINPDWLDPLQMPPILNQAAGAGQQEPPAIVEPEAPEKQTMNFEAPAPVERSGDLPQLVLDMMRRRGLA